MAGTKLSTGLLVAGVPAGYVRQLTFAPDGNLTGGGDLLPWPREEPAKVASRFGRRGATKEMAFLR
jgi:hypothetical protein